MDTKNKEIRKEKKLAWGYMVPRMMKTVLTPLSPVIPEVSYIRLIPYISKSFLLNPTALNSHVFHIL